VSTELDLGALRAHAHELRKMTETVRMLTPLDAVNTQHSPAQSDGGAT
jgi:hypothetical protein